MKFHFKINKQTNKRSIWRKKSCNSAIAWKLLGSFHLLLWWSSLHRKLIECTKTGSKLCVNYTYLASLWLLLLILRKKMLLHKNKIIFHTSRIHYISKVSHVICLVEMQVLPLDSSTKLCPLPVPKKPLPTSRGRRKKNNRNNILTLH